MKSNNGDKNSEDGMVTDCKTIRKSTTAMKRETIITKKVCAYLCEDLVAEIFARLPPKSVIRLRSLSKSWYSSIASPDFIRMYTIVRTMNTPEKVLIRHETINVNKGNSLEDIYTLHSKDKLPLCPGLGYTDITPVLFPLWSMYIIGSCNGIMCLYEETIGFVLWNFSIRRQVKMPDPPFMKAVEEDDDISLGFGFDSITHDYKIVGILEAENANTSFIYSLKSNSWSEIDFPNGARFYGNQRACLLDGALHWVETRYLDGKKTCAEYTILTFSLNSHVFGTVPLPEPTRKAREVCFDERIIEIRSVDGCLSLIISTDDSTYFSYTWVWVMREYGNVSSWSMVHELDRREKFNGVGVQKLLTNGGLLLDLRGRQPEDNDAWYEVYYPNRRLRLEVLKLKESFSIEMEMYVESLELLDKGAAWGETNLLGKKES